MAQPNRGRRPRGRNNNQNRQKFINKNQAFDSSGPSGRVRGNAQQIYEKYQALARDAQAGGAYFGRGALSMLNITHASIMR